MSDVNKKKGSVIDAFVAGAKNGMYISINSTIPNILMAFALIYILNVTGLLDLIEVVFAPIMRVFGVPGAAGAVLLGAFMSMGGGIGVAMGLFAEGMLDPRHLAIVLPAIYIMGSQVQFIGRVIGAAGVPSKHIPMMLGINVICAFAAMFLTNIIV